MRCKSCQRNFDVAEVRDVCGNCKAPITGEHKRLRMCGCCMKRDVQIKQIPACPFCAAPIK